MSTEEVRRPGGLRGAWAALAERLPQLTEIKVRTGRIEVGGKGVDEIDPPDNIADYWTNYKDCGLARANLNQFVSDVWEPGVRIESDHQPTVDYFMGGDEAPSDTPEGGFLDQAFIHAGERHQPFVAGAKTTTLNRWVRGTAFVELLKAERENPQSPITGFNHIPAETMHPQVVQQTNVLLPPDPDDLPGGVSGYKTTPRGEVAAYIQFSDNSLLGRLKRLSDDAEEILLSQNDVMKQVLDPDIGGDDNNEQGIFGTSIFSGISTDITEYNQIKRDRYEAIRVKAYGIWLVQFREEAQQIGPNEWEVTRWPDSDQDDVISGMGNLQPGEVVGVDNTVDLTKFDGEVPALEGTLGHYVDDITAPLPAPKYSVGFEKNINQFVTSRQEERYEQIIEEERRYQERKWGWALRKVAERHDGLQAEGLRLRIETEPETSPVLSLSLEETEKMKNVAEAIATLAGPTADPGTLVLDEALVTDILQLPEEVLTGLGMGDAEEAADELEEQMAAPAGNGQGGA